jgi:hypothetical protein
MHRTFLLIFATLALSLLAVSASAQTDEDCEGPVQQQDQSQNQQQDQDMNYEDANGVDGNGGINRNGHTGEDGPHGNLDGETSGQKTLGGEVVKDGDPVEVVQKTQAATEPRTLGGLKSLFR